MTPKKTNIPAKTARYSGLYIPENPSLPTVSRVRSRITSVKIALVVPTKRIAPARRATVKCESQKTFSANVTSPSRASLLKKAFCSAPTAPFRSRVLSASSSRITVSVDSSSAATKRPEPSFSSSLSPSTSTSFTTKFSKIVPVLNYSKNYPLNLPQILYVFLLSGLTSFSLCPFFVPFAHLSSFYFVWAQNLDSRTPFFRAGAPSTGIYPLIVSPPNYE